MLIDHFQHLERFEGEKFGPGLVLARRRGTYFAHHDDHA